MSKMIFALIDQHPIIQDNNKKYFLAYESGKYWLMIEETLDTLYTIEKRDNLIIK